MDKTEKQKEKEVWNIPNAVTISRLFLSLILFITLYDRKWNASLVLFIVAAVTDWLDGYLARRLDQVTAFGRIADTFVDKMLVLGTLGFLLSPLPDWFMLIFLIVLGRETFVSVIRGYYEAREIEFGANLWGKCKASIQYIVICLILIDPSSMVSYSVVIWSIWLMAGLTVCSALPYVKKAINLSRQKNQQ